MSSGNSFVDITITVSGKEAIIRRLARMDNIGDKLGLVVGNRVGMARNKLEATKYPNVTSNYVRRYMSGLQGGYVVEKSKVGKNSVAFVLANRALDKRGRSFSQFVVGYGDKEGGQSAIHRRNGWWVGRNIIASLLDDIGDAVYEEWYKE